MNLMKAHLPWGEDWFPLDRDWFGQPVEHAARFRLQYDGEVLRFSFWVDKAPQADASRTPGEFVEGLWEQEVAELFLRAPDGRYLELNVSPYGAWWCAAFSAYRERQQVLTPASAELTSELGHDWWSCSLSLKVQDLLLLAEVGWGAIGLNVTAILCPEQPVYLCWGHRDGGEPDFHLPSNFQPPAPHALPVGLPPDTWASYLTFLSKRTLTRELLLAKVRSYLETIGEAHAQSAPLDLATSTDLARGLLRLVRECSDTALPHAQAAVYYFLESDDAEPDLGSPHGFADDAAVFNSVCRHLGLADLELDLF